MKKEIAYEWNTKKKEGNKVMRWEKQSKWMEQEYMKSEWEAWKKKYWAAKQI